MAVVNVSVISSSPQIVYDPPASWTWIPDTQNLDAGGGHMVTTDPNATATITYSFSSFYYYAARWPYPVACEISFGSTTSLVDLQDHTVPDIGTNSDASPTVKSTIEFEGGTGQLVTQTIRISVPSGYELAVVDMIVFETIGSSSSASPVQSTPSAVSSTPASLPPSSTSKSVSSSKSFTPWIVLAIGISFLLGAVIVAIFILKWRRRARQTVLMREMVDSSGSTEAQALRTVQSSDLVRLDSPDRSFAQRHAYHHSPNASTSESSAQPSLNPILPFTNSHDSRTSLLTPPMMASDLPSQSSHAESSRLLGANFHEEPSIDERSISHPPSYSFAVANRSVQPVFDRKYQS